MIVYENIEKALEAIEKISLSKGKPIYYRGQNKFYERITSSIYRISDNERKKEAKKTYEFIQWIKEQNTLLPSVKAINDSLYETDLVYWAIAQHYGYKTDLIDFTTSLETAKAFSLIGRKIGDKGVIYCLWEDDIRGLSSIYACFGGSFDPNCRALIKFVDYNPFFIFPINEISRIENQHGLFLWDYCGLFSSKCNDSLMHDKEWVDTHCFYFRQTDICIDYGALRTVYPEPNSVEMIIDQYAQVENEHFFYKNYGDLLDKIKTVDPLSANSILSYFQENDFSTLNEIFYHEENTFYPHSRMKTLSDKKDLSFISKLEHDSKSLDFVNSWLQSLNINEYTIYTSTDPIVKLYCELINEVLALKGIFPKFSAEALSIILQKVISILGSLLIMVSNNSPQSYANALAKLSDYQFNLFDSGCNIDSILDILREQVCLNDLASEIWGDECVFLKIIGCNDTTSVGVLPLQFVNDISSEYRKKLWDTLQLLSEKGLLSATQIVILESGESKRVFKNKESLNLKDLFNYVSIPAVLFDASDMLCIMLHCFIPWQIVMCPKRNRLYNPLDYKEIRLMDGENIPNSKLFYWAGAYISLSDKNE